MFAVFFSELVFLVEILAFSMLSPLGLAFYFLRGMVVSIWDRKYH